MKTPPELDIKVPKARALQSLPESKSEAQSKTAGDARRKRRLSELADQLGTFENVMPLEELLALRQNG